MPIRNYEIVDEAGLFAAHPHLFKRVPDYTAINRARLARFDLSQFILDKGDEVPATPEPGATVSVGAPIPEPSAVAGSQIHLEETIEQAEKRERAAATVASGQVNQQAASATVHEDDEFDAIPLHMR